MVLVSLIYNFFTNETFLANKLTNFSRSNFALVNPISNVGQIMTPTNTTAPQIFRPSYIKYLRSCRSQMWTEKSRRAFKNVPGSKCTY